MKEQKEQYTFNKQKRPRNIAAKIAGALLCFAGLGVIGYFVAVEYNKPPEIIYQPPVIERSEPEPEEEPEPAEPAEPAEFYPVGKLIVSTTREEYVDGDIQLYLPRLELQAPVFNGVDEETLKKGLGLFDYAQLPGPLEQNANVSIAGHRDIYGKEFYFIDQVELGDLVYLTCQGNLYTYEVEESFITNPYDWDPIRVREYPCITLQSCTPIGIANERIFVVGRLIGVTPGADFPVLEAPEDLPAV